MNFINTKYSKRDGGHYSAAVMHGNLLFISGQLSIDPETGKRPDGGFPVEVKQALRNMDMVLHDAGLSKDDVVMCRVYLPDVDYWAECNRIYADFFGEHKPARIVIPTKPMYGGCLVEIEAIAAAGDGSVNNAL